MVNITQRRTKCERVLSRQLTSCLLKQFSHCRPIDCRGKLRRSVHPKSSILRGTARALNPIKAHIIRKKMLGFNDKTVVVVSTKTQRPVALRHNASMCTSSQTTCLFLRQPLEDNLDERYASSLHSDHKRRGRIIARLYRTLSGKHGAPFLG